MAYEALAASYDRLTVDIPYADLARYYESLWSLYGLRPETVLDLACGTGSLSVLLAERSLQVIGVDASEEMLTEAAEKAASMEAPPFFVRQKMQRLRLPAPVDLAVCCLDGINYLTDPADCRETFRRVHANLNPGGLFVFDVNTEAKLRGLDGQVFLDEDEDVFCVWRAAFDEARRVCSYGMDVFQRRGRLWQRSQELHEEYAYTVDELAAWLKGAGFTDVRVFGDRSMEPPTDHEQRIFIAAAKAFPSGEGAIRKGRPYLEREEYQ